MRRPVYFINKYHKSNYLRLLEIVGSDNKECSPSSYILASIGIMEENEGALATIERYYFPDRVDFEALLKDLGSNAGNRALIKLAANLYDSANYANISDVFTALDDIYQAVAYQALLLKFPSFSKTWDSRYPDYKE